jgi:hypothetical protein
MITAQQFTMEELETVPWASELIEEAEIQRDQIKAAESAIRVLFEWAEETSDEDTKIALGRMMAGHDDLSESLAWAWSVVSTRACYMDVDNMVSKKKVRNFS